MWYHSRLFFTILSLINGATLVYNFGNNLGTYISAFGMIYLLILSYAYDQNRGF